MGDPPMGEDCASVTPAVSDTTMLAAVATPFQSRVVTDRNPTWTATSGEW